jgi:succinate dehydrogenase / fumarate reductase, cytochrome b subunit
MSSNVHFLDSSIGRKVLMSLTGLFLCSFLIVHAIGNTQLFHNDEGLAFNQYSVFMTSFPPIKVISYLLYITIIVHVLNGFRLALQNKKARPIGYAARKDPRSSTWASKNMALLGTIVLIFLVTHMANFWYQYKFGDVKWVQYTVDIRSGHVLGAPRVLDTAEGMIPHEFLAADANGTPVKVIVLKDLYMVVKVAFQEMWIVALYLIGMAALAYHLVHGFQSAFQTIGWRHKIYTPLIQGVGVWFFGIILPLVFAAMPVYFFFFKS